MDLGHSWEPMKPNNSSVSQKTTKKGRAKSLKCLLGFVVSGWCDLAFWVCDSVIGGSSPSGALCHPPAVYSLPTGATLLRSLSIEHLFPGSCMETFEFNGRGYHAAERPVVVGIEGARRIGPALPGNRPDTGRERQFRKELRTACASAAAWGNAGAGAAAIRNLNQSRLWLCRKSPHTPPTGRCKRS